MLIVWSRDMVELNARERFDESLHDSPVKSKSDLFQHKFSVDLQNDELWISLHLKFSNSLYKAESPMVGALYSASLLEQWNSSLKDIETLVPSRSYNTTPILPLRWVNNSPKARRHPLVSIEHISCKSGFHATVHTRQMEIELIDSTELSFTVPWE